MEAEAKSISEKEQSITRDSEEEDSAISSLSEEQHEVYNSALDGYVSLGGDDLQIEHVLHGRRRNGKELRTASHRVGAEEEVRVAEGVRDRIDGHCRLQHQRNDTPLVRGNR